MGFKAKEDPKYVSRVIASICVRFQIHHGGMFVYYPTKEYVDGEVIEMNWDWDVDHMSYMDIAKLIKSLGYVRFQCIWYKDPKLVVARGLKPLQNDKDLLQMIEDIKGYELIELYVDHLIDTPIVVEKGSVEVDNDGIVNVSELDTEDDEEYLADEDIEGSDEDVEDSEDEDLEDMEDSDYDEKWDWTCVLPTEVINEVRNKAKNPNPNATSFQDFYGEEDDSDQLETPPDSEDDEAQIPKFPTFKMPEMGDGIRLEVGMKFNSKQLVKDAVKEYAMQLKKNVVFKQNDSKRMVVKCVKGCPFNMRFSKRVGNEYWQFVSSNDDHTCHRTPRNRQAKTEWLAKKFIPTLRHTPEMKPKGLIAESIQKWGVKLSRHQAYRAKRRAIELIQGAGSEQYKHLRSYADELLRSNPNSTVIIKCNPTSRGPIFERIYVCLEGCKAAFVHTCRPLIGLDACFLKGEHGGQLMSAVGKDGNNMMIPIAYAVVEAETRDSWQWFLDLLLNDLCDLQQRQYSFISDQQKGLVDAIKNQGSDVEHRLCVKHLYGNWRKKYPGKDMKDVLWWAARATTVPEWQRAMNKMKHMSEPAWKDMMQLPPSCWTRSHYNEHSQCDLQVNNMCEAFNIAILEHRDKPIITLLEGLKNYLTNRIGDQKGLMDRYSGKICPKIQKAIERRKREADGWSPLWHADDDFALFSVSNEHDTFSVNLSQMTCACRKWQLSGIPCCHAITCIWHNTANPEDYVSHYYSKSTFMSTYSYIIKPSNGPGLWPETDTVPINPPVMRRAPGRPKKKRNKANDEPRPLNKLPRLLPTVKCKKCGKLGHNVRTCKGKTSADREIPKGGNKSKKKNFKGAGCSTGPQEYQASQPTQESQAQWSQAPQPTQES